MADADGLQEGDPARAALAIRRVLDMEDAPLRLPLGAEAVGKLTRDIVEQLLARTADAPGEDTVDILRGLLDDDTVDSSDPPLGISEAAARVGLSTHTLRYYEDQGLVGPSRDSTGYRLHHPADLRRLVFLTRMRLSGMGMAELKRYVALIEQGEATFPERRAIMVAQRDRIRRQLRELTLALETTEYKIRVYTPEG